MEKGPSWMQFCGKCGEVMKLEWWPPRGRRGYCCSRCRFEEHFLRVEWTLGVPESLDLREVGRVS